MLLDGSRAQSTHSCTNWSQQRENKSVRGDVFQQLSEWLTVSPSKLHIQQMALSVSIGAAAQKDNSSVCAWGDYSIPLLFSPLAPFKHKSRATDTPEQWNHTNAQGEKKTTRTRTGSMGKFLTTCKRERRSSNPLGKKRPYPGSDWKRSKNILGRNTNWFLQINVFLFRNVQTENLNSYQTVGHIARRFL